MLLPAVGINTDHVVGLRPAAERSCCSRSSLPCLHFAVWLLLAVIGARLSWNYSLFTRPPYYNHCIQRLRNVSEYSIKMIKFKIKACVVWHVLRLTQSFTWAVCVMLEMWKACEASAASLTFVLVSSYCKFEQQHFLLNHFCSADINMPGSL